MLVALGGSHTADWIDAGLYDPGKHYMEVLKTADPYSLRIRLHELHAPPDQPLWNPPANVPVAPPKRTPLPVPANVSAGTGVVHEGYMYYYACFIWHGCQNWGWYDCIVPNHMDQMIFTSDGRRIEDR